MILFRIRVFCIISLCAWGGAGCTYDSKCLAGDASCSLMAAFLMYDVCRVPYYKMSDPLIRGSVMIEYAAQASKGSSGSPTLVQYGTLGGANDFYGSGGLLAPNGKICAPPMINWE